MNNFEVIIPNDDRCFKFTPDGLFMNNRLFESSVVDCLPNTVEITSKFIRIVTNFGYCEINEYGISVLPIEEATFR